MRADFSIAALDSPLKRIPARVGQRCPSAPRVAVRMREQFWRKTNRSHACGALGTALPYLRVLVAATILVASAAAHGADLDRNFLNPPPSARPRTLWMWMNGNVTADGITRDLEAMHRVGLGGAMIFNAAESIPKGSVDYGGAEWLKLMTHAAREASRLGLELGLHNGPGWSSSGGPWITPAMSMQQLVWSETRVVGPGKRTLTLAQPFMKLNFYRDACVLA